MKEENLLEGHGQPQNLQNCVIEQNKIFFNVKKKPTTTLRTIFLASLCKGASYLNKGRVIDHL